MFTSLFTRGSNCEALTRKLLVFWIGGCLWEVVAYERWLHSLLAEVSHDEAKMRERRETSAGFRRVSYHACAGVSLTTSDVFLTCDTTHRTGLRAKLQLKAGVYVVENSSQCETMPRTPQSRKFGESASPRTPIKPVGSGKDVRCLLCGLDFKGERC